MVSNKPSSKENKNELGGSKLRLLSTEMCGSVACWIFVEDSKVTAVSIFRANYLEDGGRKFIRNVTNYL
jgi:hypothetical protein